MPRSALVPLMDIGKVFSISPSAGMVITGVVGGIALSVNVTSVPGSETLLELSVAFALIT